MGVRGTDSKLPIFGCGAGEKTAAFRLPSKSTGNRCMSGFCRVCDNCITRTFGGRDDQAYLAPGAVGEGGMGGKGGALSGGPS